MGKYWDWSETDAYLSAGAVTSDILDMLKYAQIQLDNDNVFSECNKTLKDINTSTKSYGYKYGRNRYVLDY